MRRANEYSSSLKFIPNTNNKEATVVSRSKGTLRTVKISDDPHTPPSCCAHSTTGSGFPCFHSVAVLVRRFGPSLLHNFIHQRHLTAQWKLQYDNVYFNLPAEDEVERVITLGQTLVAKEQNVSIPVALPPPRGRPSSKAGKRKKGFLEQGPSAKRTRSYSCSICKVDGHTMDDCPLRQIFPDNS